MYVERRHDIVGDASCQGPLGYRAEWCVKGTLVTEGGACGNFLVSQ